MTEARDAVFVGRGKILWATLAQRIWGSLTCAELSTGICGFSPAAIVGAFLSEQRRPPRPQWSRRAVRARIAALEQMANEPKTRDGKGLEH
jgi:hypothetical protein